MDDYFSDPGFVALFGAVVLARFLLPLTIFRWPLPGVVACLVLDAVDQTVFQTFGYDPPFYQGYDKAMDVFYLAMAFVATLRNWTDLAAFGIARVLFFYRQVGVVAFELSGVRALLLVFPNVFEYFFIAYESIRARWNPRRLVRRSWLLVAAAIWLFVKLPQEYWLHVAKLDFTDTLRDVAWFGPLVVTVLVVAALAVQLVVRPRLPGADHAFQLVAPPLPDELATPAARREWALANVRVWSPATLEKTLLVGLLLVLFATILPGLDPTVLRMLAWTAAFVALNVVVELALARRGFSTDSQVRSFVLRLALNAGLVAFVDQQLYDALALREALLFSLLFSTIVTAYDRYRPVYELRRSRALDAAG